ncbi:type III restriction-modification system endonuclease [Psychrobacter pacificensis]|uniref:type III restriction-modification system endonuclease n=1 Tax=Psychrobacter pacificensis TaxID=112002 RepID=UPI003D08A845
MAGFNFEPNLPHQEKAIIALIKSFANVEFHSSSDYTINQYVNPKISFKATALATDIEQVQKDNGIFGTDKRSDDPVFDISMETGTGKTYTYTKTMYELNKIYGLFKFIVVVPTLSIKAGTVNFLKSDALREHFRHDFQGEYHDKQIVTYVVESKKSKKGKRSYMPESVTQFVNASHGDKSKIHVLVINQGMINSPTIQEERFDRALLGEKYDRAIDALAGINPVVIIDEPHKFPQTGKTWKSISNLEAQFTLRYGATFNDEYKNLIYHLTAVDAFNQDLVKGVTAYVETLSGNDAAKLTLKSLNGKEAEFELSENGTKTRHTLGKDDSLSNIHSAIHSLNIEKLNKTTLVLSNGIELKKDQSINPYSYLESLQDSMIQKAIKEHFKLERELLTRSPRIKPLTLFFIDDIEGYRDGNELAGSLKTQFETWVLAIAKSYLAKETDPFYKQYLQRTIKDISLTHGGYFSKDNTGNDEKIEAEINEILHDKESLLSLDNPRRFIFSKWTLREGWDNPNVFQICKLRSSGSTTSKLQEVGRGLRLPVNEHMAREKTDDFRLNYYVDFTEKDFVEELTQEINDTSASEVVPEELNNELVEQIKNHYEVSKRELSNQLYDQNLIDDDEKFLEGGYQALKDLYPNAFAQKLKKDKVVDKSKTDTKNKTKVRIGKYEELKELWELINQRAILEYQFEDEVNFYENLLMDYLKQEIAANNFSKTGLVTKVSKLHIHNNQAGYQSVYDDEDDFAKISTMSYGSFLRQLSEKTYIKLPTLHKAFVTLKHLKDKDEQGLDINDYLNVQTIRKFTDGIRSYLLHNAMQKFEVSYNVISNKVHPTSYTDSDGQPYSEIKSSNLGKHYDKAKPSDDFLFEDIFYDSPLEKQNMKEQIKSVTVFSKIPSKSIRIPVSGGESYSPDFAYVVETDGGQTLNLIVETKGTNSSYDLRSTEQRKIKHAEKLFRQMKADGFNVSFDTQFQDDLVKDIINKALVQTT